LRVVSWYACSRRSPNRRQRAEHASCTGCFESGRSGDRPYSGCVVTDCNCSTCNCGDSVSTIGEGGDSDRGVALSACVTAAVRRLPVQASFELGRSGDRPYYGGVAKDCARAMVLEASCACWRRFSDRRLQDWSLPSKVRSVNAQCAHALRIIVSPSRLLS